MIVRETILVASNGDTRMFDDIINGSGCNVLRASIRTAVRSTKRFMHEFGQGIPVAIVHGQTPDEASAIATYLKRACNSMHVIAISDQVAEPSREGDKEYDVIIPNRRHDLRQILETFLGFKEW